MKRVYPHNLISASNAYIRDYRLSFIADSQIEHNLRNIVWRMITLKLKTTIKERVLKRVETTEEKTVTT